MSELLNLKMKSASTGTVPDFTVPFSVTLTQLQRNEFLKSSQHYETWIANLRLAEWDNVGRWELGKRRSGKYEIVLLMNLMLVFGILI